MWSSFASPLHNALGVRDYIHVMDIASGHLAALAKIETDRPNYRVVNERAEIV